MAQPMKSPIKVPLYCETGANPAIEWQTWVSTFKMAVLSKENIYIDQLLRLKQNAVDLFNPILPTSEEQIQNRGPIIDRYT